VVLQRRGTGCAARLHQFMVAALENDALVQEAPAIVGCRTQSALAHANLMAA
jgi:hypothetical protein